jgi:hypothetical protein
VCAVVVSLREHARDAEARVAGGRVGGRAEVETRVDARHWWCFGEERKVEAEALLDELSTEKDEPGAVQDNKDLGTKTVRAQRIAVSQSTWSTDRNPNDPQVSQERRRRSTRRPTPFGC